MEENQLFIDENDKPELIEFYQSKLKRIESERDRIIRTLVQLGVDLKKDNQILIKENYDRNWKWEEKISFALNKIGRISKKSEIFNVIIKFEPELNNVNSRNSIGASLSRLSSSGSDYQTLGKLDIKGVRAYYGLPHWFDKESGKVFKGFSGSFANTDYSIDQETNESVID